MRSRGMWWIRTSIEEKIVLGFVLSLLAMAGTGWLAYRTSRGMITSEQLVSHTYEVIADLESGLSVLTDAETAQRGFLLTGDDHFLQDCNAAASKVNGWMAGVRSLTADNPGQQERLSQLEPIIQKRLESLRNRIHVRQQEGLQAAADAVALREGKNLMDEIERQIFALRSTETLLLRERIEAAVHSARRNTAVIVAATVLACGIGIFAVAVIRRDLHKLRLAETELQRRASALESANKELEAFSYSVSHDLRAPLRHIDGFVKLLARQEPEDGNGKSHRYLNIIGDSARQMGILIDDLLVFSRMGRAELRHSQVDSNALVHEAVHSLQPECEGRNIDWVIADLPEVTADPTMFRQVWINLIANAIKYTRPRDRARIEISCLPTSADEHIFRVRDNGVGFDMQYVNKLFGVFQRLHRADEFEGTGIGLANVSRIVQRHGGRVWADAKVNEGASFYFSLPKTAKPIIPTKA